MSQLKTSRRPAVGSGTKGHHCFLESFHNRTGFSPGVTPVMWWKPHCARVRPPCRQEDPLLPTARKLAAVPERRPIAAGGEEVLLQCQSERSWSRAARARATCTVQPPRGSVVETPVISVARFSR